MLSYEVLELLPFTVLKVEGRIDGNSSADLDRTVRSLIQKGTRQLVFDLRNVTYISSAGLRVFMATYKNLTAGGGEVLLYGLTESCKMVFTMSGFLNYFKVLESLEQLSVDNPNPDGETGLIEERIGDYILSYQQGSGQLARFYSIGNVEKLEHAAYSEQDVVAVDPAAICFGAGLAALGESYGEYKNYFGEAIVLNHHLFVYPATRRPVADYMVYSPEGKDVRYRFLHGFGFSDEIDRIIHFQSVTDSQPLSGLIAAIGSFFNYKQMGIVVMAETKALYGMHFKKVPLEENRPVNGASLFDNRNFPDWFNFPVDRADSDSIVIMAGIASVNRETASAEFNALVPMDSGFHLHGAVFTHNLVDFKIPRFGDELQRVLSEFQLEKIQHILGNTLLSKGLIAITELKG